MRKQIEELSDVEKELKAICDKLSHFRPGAIKLRSIRTRLLNVIYALNELDTKDTAQKRTLNTDNQTPSVMWITQFVAALFEQHLKDHHK